MKLCGHTLKRARVEKGLTQLQLAALCHVSQQSLAKWEGDEATPRPASLRALAEALGVTPRELCVDASRGGVLSPEIPHASVVVAQVAPDLLSRLTARLAGMPAGKLQALAILLDVDF